MKNPIKAMMGRRPNSAADIENELARLGQKLADHQRRRSEVLQALEEAKEARRSVLAEEDAIIAEATANVRRLEAEALEHSQMIEEFEAAIAGAEERFRQAADQEKRRAAAEKLEKTAAAVDALASELQKGVLSVAGTVKKLRQCIPADLGVFDIDYNSRPPKRPEHLNDFSSGREAIAAVLAEVILAELPELFDFVNVETRTFGTRHAVALIAVGEPTAQQVNVLAWDTRDAIGLSASEAIDALITSRLRKRAAGVLAGETQTDGAAVKIVEPYKAPPPPPELRIVGLQNFKYLIGKPGYKPRYEAVMEGSDHYVREEVAKAAIARGWAAPHGSSAANDFLQKRSARKSVPYGFGPSIDTYLDLGDPLGLQRAYEAVKAEVAARDNQAEIEEVARALG